MYVDTAVVTWLFATVRDVEPAVYTDYGIDYDDYDLDGEDKAIETRFALEPRRVGDRSLEEGCYHSESSADSENE
jgi:hypothetical protein